MAKSYSEETKAAVYGLRGKNSRDYFYVGCTKYNPESRLNDHLYQALSGWHANKHFANKVKKMGVDNIACDVLEITGLGDQWLAEKHWIEKLVSDGHKLVNRIHNEIHYDINGSSVITKEKREWVEAFTSSPPPKVKSPIPQLQDLFQELIVSFHGALKAVNAHLVSTGYFDEQGKA